MVYIIFTTHHKNYHLECLNELNELFAFIIIAKNTNKAKLQFFMAYFV